MRSLATLLLSLVVSGCASVAIPPQPDRLFRDALFAPPNERVSATDVFALSDEMKRYLLVEIAGELNAKGALQGLVDALASKNHLKIEYDSAQTRNAAQTFKERAGNCLSLVIMTSALARELGLPVYYYGVAVEETWSRAGGLYFSSGHVNLTVGKRFYDMDGRASSSGLIMIDFNPVPANRKQRTWPLTEATILAMYMNNRSAEALARGQLDNAYWWVKEAIRQDPAFPGAHNTLGVIYRRHGNLAEAENALTHALELAPSNIQVMSNLSIVLNELGRFDEARRLTAMLERARPYRPYYFFDQGQTAMQAGDFPTAREMFAKEIERDADNHEFHFWLGMAYYRLGNLSRARKHLTNAMDFSPTRNERDLYAAKRDKLRAYQEKAARAG